MASTPVAELKDPRPRGTQRHDLLDVMMIALYAVLSGGRTAVDMAVFAEATHDFLGQFLRLRKGYRATTPSVGCSADWIRTSSVLAS